MPPQDVSLKVTTYTKKKYVFGSNHAVPMKVPRKVQSYLFWGFVCKCREVTPSDKNRVFIPPQEVSLNLLRGSQKPQKSRFFTHQGSFRENAQEGSKTPISWGVYTTVAK